MSRIAVAGSAVVLLAVLTACSGGGTGEESGSGADTERLSADDATTALLTETNIGDEYVVGDDDSQEDDSPLGCLDALDGMDETDAPTEVDRSFEFDNEFGLPAIGSQVSSYDATGDAADAFDAFRSALDGCTSVDETGDDGTHTTLTVSMDEESSTTDADDQINLVATGNIGSDGMEFPFGLFFSVARVDNHVTSVGIVDLGEEAGSSMDAYVRVAVDRLTAVTAGEEPEDVAVDVSGEVTEGAGESSAEAATEGGDPVFLPLDGGTYTWASGVTLTLSVERVEPWGKTDDFCGDGSCGIANPDDTRFVFKYEVTVPEDYAEPFDPLSCPGQLTVTSGNDDEALSGVAGDYAQYLDGKIFPGQSKFGIEEYYIEKAYADEEFSIESTCGDADFGGESAYFVGPIRKTT